MQKARKRTPKSSYYNEGRFFLNFWDEKKYNKQKWTG
jgi:hypothetical protein